MEVGSPQVPEQVAVQQPARLQWISAFNFYGGVMKPRLLIELGLFARCVSAPWATLSLICPFHSQRKSVCYLCVGVWLRRGGTTAKTFCISYILKSIETIQIRQQPGAWKPLWETHSWIFVFKFETSNLILGEEMMKNQEGGRTSTFIGDSSFPSACCRNVWLLLLFLQRCEQRVCLSF